MSVPEIARHIGADSLGYLSLPGLFKAVGLGGDRLCSGCFTGDYPVPVQIERALDGKLALEDDRRQEDAADAAQEQLELDLGQEEMDHDRMPIGADH